MLPRFRSALVAGTTSMGVSAALRAFSASASVSTSITISAAATATSSSFQPVTCHSTTTTSSTSTPSSFLVRSYTTSQPNHIRFQDIPKDSVAPPEKIDNIEELRTLLKSDRSVGAKQDLAHELLVATKKASKTNPPYETVIGDLEYIYDALEKEDPTISALFQSVNVKPEEYKKGIAKTKRSLHPVSVAFLEKLRAARKISTLHIIIANMKNLVRESRNQVLATITSAVALTDKQKQRLVVALQPHVEGKQSVVLEEIIDPTLQGGMQVRVAGKFVDLSIREPFQQTLQNLKGKSIIS